MKTNRFRIKHCYLTSVPDVKEVSITLLETNENIRGTSYGTIDHPEFTKLRNKLEKQGYIKTWREVRNGDTVLKPFSLNGMRFKKNDKFCCACALGIKMKIYKDER